MDSDIQTKFRVTVWQPYLSRRMLAYSGEKERVTLSGQDDELQRESFTWTVVEDVWAGVTDDEARSTLHEKFVNDFQVSLAPEVRDMRAFGSFIDEVAAVANSNKSAWSSSQSPQAEPGAAPLMINALLAFHLQLAWIYETFKDVPGASVSVR